MRQQLGRRIGGGRTAEVYEWGAGEVVKLFAPALPNEQAEREASVAAVVTAAGVPAPRFVGTVHVGGRIGLIYERVDGQPLLAELARRPWRVLGLARMLADLHLAIHRRPADPRLPPQRTALRHAIDAVDELPGSLRAFVIDHLDMLRDGELICHGDFHPDNVLLAGDGAVAIDWMTATRGCPAGDVARTLLILRHAALPPELGTVKLMTFGVLRRLLVWGYWRRYRAGSAIREADLAPWWIPLSAARLRESIPAEERDYLLRRIAAAARRPK